MPILTRRDWLNLTLGTGAAVAVDARTLFGQQRLLTRAIPSSGEQLPVIGLGSSATFSQTARQEDVTALRDVLQTLLDNGGTLFDTAPGYGASEEVAARIVREHKWESRLFWATKVNVASRGNAVADPVAATGRLTSTPGPRRSSSSSGC